MIYDSIAKIVGIMYGRGERRGRGLHVIAVREGKRWEKVEYLI